MGSDIGLDLEMRVGRTGDLVVFGELVGLEILFDCRFGWVGLDI